MIEFFTCFIGSCIYDCIFRSASKATFIVRYSKNQAKDLIRVLYGKKRIVSLLHRDRRLRSQEYISNSSLRGLRKNTLRITEKQLPDSHIISQSQSTGDFSRILGVSSSRLAGSEGWVGMCGAPSPNNIQYLREYLDYTVEGRR